MKFLFFGVATPASGPMKAAGHIQIFWENDDTSGRFISYSASLCQWTDDGFHCRLVPHQPITAVG